MWRPKLFRGSFPLALLGLITCSTLAVAQSKYLPGDTFTQPLAGGGIGPEMIVVREGSFVFGGGRAGDDPEELVIEFQHPFAISTTEITAGMYRQFLEATNSADLASLGVTDDKLPIAGITWDQAEAFVSWLSLQTGYHYSLPSSTQWEYAARAGSTKTYSWGDKVGEGNANCTECGVPFEGASAPVASFKPNAWGIYDMQGNVWEWTKDCMDPNSRPPPHGMPQLFGNCERRELRGGSARSDAWSIRLNSRASAERQTRLPDLGMRVVMVLPR